jgi:solute carrier family 25 folate transporter 32
MVETESAFSAKAVAPLIAGVLGGTVSTVLLYPLDLIKVRMQVNEGAAAKTVRSTRLHSWTVFQAVLQHEGVAGLYQGLNPAVVGSAISWGGYLFLYEGMKRRYLKYKDPDHTSGDYYFSAGENFVLACASGAVLVGLTNPIWLIKTRMQLQMTQTAISRGMKDPYTGMLNAARTIVREEGVSALYKGAVPALILTSHGGVQFVVYEYLKNYFQFSRTDRDPAMSVVQRFQLSFSFLAMGAVSKV